MKLCQVLSRWAFSVGVCTFFYGKKGGEDTTIHSCSLLVKAGLWYLVSKGSTQPGRASARFRVKVDALLSCAAVNKFRSTAVLVSGSRRFHDKRPGLGGFK